MDKRTIDILRKMGACKTAITWCKSQPSRRAAWENCDYADWMLWLISKTIKKHGSAQHRKLVEITCRIVKPVVWAEHPARSTPRKAILLALRWAQGDRGIIIEQLRSAAYAAYAAEAADAAADAAYYAAYAASYAADAADAADATADAASYAADAAGAETPRRLANRVRRYYPRPPRLTR